MDARENNSIQLLLSRQFGSFEELAVMARAWDIDFRQLSKNHSVTALNQIQVGSMLFSDLTCGCFARHDGASPENMFTFSLPDADCPEFRIFGHQIDQPNLLLSRGDQEFDAFVRPGYQISNFSIPKTVVEEYCESNFGCSADEMLQSWSRVNLIDLRAAADVRNLARQLSTLAQAPNLSRQPDPVQSFESQLLESLFKLHSLENLSKEKTNTVSRKRIIERALEFIKEHENEPLSVEDVAKAAHISQRTLLRVFNREFGISPKKFLFGQRMYGAYRQLWRSSPSEIRIVDVANAWGFWHMGQFARDYRGFFGELPSATLNKSSANLFI